MKKIFHEYWSLLLGFTIIILAHPISLIFSTDILSYGNNWSSYIIDPILAFYLTISFWIVGIMLCIFKMKK